MRIEIGRQHLSVRARDYRDCILALGIGGDQRYAGRSRNLPNRISIYVGLFEALSQLCREHIAS